MLVRLRCECLANPAITVVEQSAERTAHLTPVVFDDHNDGARPATRARLTPVVWARVLVMASSTGVSLH
jgi:hypothetical protein